MNVTIRAVAPALTVSSFGKLSRILLWNLFESGLVPGCLNVYGLTPNIDYGPMGRFVSELSSRRLNTNTLLYVGMPDSGFIRECGTGSETVRAIFTSFDSYPILPQFKEAIKKYASIVFVAGDYDLNGLTAEGLDVPIVKIPIAISPEFLEPEKNIPLIDIADEYMFYSVFNWDERKCPSELLRAYWSSFQDNESVVLFLKVFYKSGIDSSARALVERIEEIRKQTSLDHYPKLFVVGTPQSEAQMNAIHTRGDCYVGLSRGEGIQLSLTEAYARGKRLIYLPRVSPFTEEEKKTIFNGRVSMSMSPVFGITENPQYHGVRNWGCPDVGSLMDHMKAVYSTRDNPIPDPFNGYMPFFKPIHSLINNYLESLL